MKFSVTTIILSLLCAQTSGASLRGLHQKKPAQHVASTKNSEELKNSYSTTKDTKYTDITKAEAQAQKAHMIKGTKEEQKEEDKVQMLKKPSKGATL